MKAAVANFVIRSINAIIRLLPTRPLFVVHGFPDDEENSLRLAALAAAQLNERWSVVLLCIDPKRARELLLRANRSATYPTAVPRFIRRDSARGILSFLFARVVCYTHGLFGSPDAGKRRLHVYLGHGTGPKTATHRGTTANHRPHLAFGNNQAWGRQILKDLGVVEDERYVVAANAREDAFREPAAVASVLGVPEDHHLVVWLPTVRRTIQMRRDQWQDGLTAEESPEATAQLRRLRDLAAERNITILSKFHKLDDDAAVMLASGISVVTSEQLDNAGLSFFQLLAASDALVTDYSSVFVDYLAHHRNFALYFPDEAQFERDRGFNAPDFRELASDLILRDDATMADFLDHVRDGADWQLQTRRNLADTIGLAPAPPNGSSATENMFSVITERALRAGITLL